MTIALAADRTQNKTPLRRRAPRADTVARAPGRLLSKAQIAGRLALVDRRPIVIAAERGLAVRVRSGALWVTHNREDTIIGAGDRFVADRSSPVVISALETTELRVDWPSREDDEWLSPGLEREDIAR